MPARKQLPWTSQEKAILSDVYPHEQGLDEAKRIILREAESERVVEEQALRLERARPKTLAEKLDMLARGEATVVANIPLRRVSYAGTLGGVASGML